MSDVEDTDYFETLAWINKQRARAGVERLDHIPPFEGCRHPLVIAVPHAVRQTRTTLWCVAEGLHHQYHLPEGARAFMHKADVGFYPQLETTLTHCPELVHRVTCPDSSTARLRAG